MRLIFLGWSLIDANWSEGASVSPHWRAYCNYDDGAVVSARGHSVALQPGHLVVIPAWLPWSRACRGQVRHLNALFDLPTLPREVIAPSARIVTLGGPGSPLADDWMELGLQLTSVPHATIVHVANSYALIYRAVADVCTQIGIDHVALKTGPTNSMGAIETFIERHLGDAMPVAAIAQFAGCSTTELGRRFQSTYGTSPARWIRQRRISMAADLLRCCDDTIEDIAKRCGFNERTRFTKAFTARLGSSPGAWRRRERG